MFENFRRKRSQTSFYKILYVIGYLFLFEYSSSSQLIYVPVLGSNPLHIGKEIDLIYHAGQVCWYKILFRVCLLLHSFLQKIHLSRLLRHPRARGDKLYSYSVTIFENKIHEKKKTIFDCVDSFNSESYSDSGSVKIFLHLFPLHY